ncbi:MAG: insulinase family protein [Alphaproteobacteria bacterium]|nr:insulinase family protein [Alphaproteobacteria bacterium]
MSRYKFLFLLLLLFPLAVNAKGLFGAEEFYLANGMRVIVVPNHRVPVVKHMVWYKNGASDENIGKGGTAHLLEHLMFRGTKDVSGQKFNIMMEENGAESNAFTGQDMTAYHQFLDVSRLELAMLLEADRMVNLQFDNDAFVAERDIVFQERKQRVDNNPVGKFREALNRILWQQHPYSRPITGTDKEIRSLTQKDVSDYYKKYYVPNNAVLILAGDIDVNKARDLATKYYGDLKSREIEETNWPDVSEKFSATLDMQDEKISGVRILRAYIAPSFMKNPENVYDLQVLAAYMGGGDTSKLYKKLVLEQKKLLSISVDYDPVSRSYGTFSVSMIPNNGVSSDEALKELDKAWQEALSELDEQELDKIKRKLSAGLVYLKDNPEDAAYVVGSMAISGMSLEDIESQEQKIKNVELQRLLNSAKYLVASTSNVTGILRPKENKQ